MKLIKKSAITVIGLFLLLIGIVFIVLPGPAVLIIPLALAILAKEYPIAEKWLRRFQRSMRRSAVWMDQKWRTFRQRS